MAEDVAKKIVLIGDFAVGKTSLVRRFVHNAYDDKYIQTVGAKVSKKNIQYRVADKEINLTLMIWDILGQKEYHHIHRASFKNVTGAIVVCDITRISTLKSIFEYWLPELFKVAGRVPVIFAVNKADLKDTVIAEFGLQDMIDELVRHNLSNLTLSRCYLASAKTGENVNEAFKVIGAMTLFNKPYKEERIEDEKEPMIIKTYAKKISKLTVNPKTPKEALDLIIVDYMHNFGDEVKALDYLQECFTSAGLVLAHPSKKKLELFVELLYNVELRLATIPPEKIEENKTRREKIVADVEEDVLSGW